MTSTYPGTLDSFTTGHVDDVGEIIHAATVNDLADAVNKIETELGTNPKGAASNVGARIAAITGLPDQTSANGKWLKSVSGAAVWTPLAESELAFTDITTGDVSSTKHGFTPKAPADATRFLNGAAAPIYAQVKDSDLSTSDITTNNAGTSKHGFVPKLPNDATKYYDGTGNYTSPAGASPGGGASARLYDYKVTGSDKASIDTFIDGTTVANFAGYDTLEIWLVSRTDEAVLLSGLSMYFNNDTGANYERAAVSSSTGGTTPITAFNTGESGFLATTTGSSMGANVPGLTRMTIPFYSETGFTKAAECSTWTLDTTSGNTHRQVSVQASIWNNTAAITRFQVAPTTAAKKLVVGTHLIIYGR